MKAEHTLTETVQRTFSEMAFIDVEPTTESASLPKTSQIVEITYEVEKTGSHDGSRGEIALVLPLACKRVIVENIYGSEWDSLDSEKIDDCLLEILNVIAGAFLSDRYGPDVKRELSLPRLVFDATDLENATATERLFFDAEGTVFLVVHRAR